MLSELAKKISEYGAPLLSSILGTPLAGIALNLLVRTFGIDATKPEQLLTTILRDPDAAVKIKELELKNAEMLEAIALQKFQISTQDIQDARRANLTYLTASSQPATAFLNAIMPGLVTIILGVGIFSCAWGVMIMTTEKSDHDILNMILGQLMLAFGYSIKFWFGNSSN